MKQHMAAERTRIGRPARAGSLRARVLGALGAEKGQALIELALCLPILLTVVTGVMSFGIAIDNYMQLTDAVAVGARSLSLLRLNTTDPCAVSYAAVTNAAPALVLQGTISVTTTMYAPLATNGSGGGQLGSYAGRTCSSSSNTTGAAGNLVQYGGVQVTATFPCNLQVYGLNYWSSCTLSSRSTEVVQ